MILELRPASAIRRAGPPLRRRSPSSSTWEKLKTGRPQARPETSWLIVSSAAERLADAI